MYPSSQKPRITYRSERKVSRRNHLCSNRGQFPSQVLQSLIQETTLFQQGRVPPARWSQLCFSLLWRNSRALLASLECNSSAPVSDSFSSPRRTVKLFPGESCLGSALPRAFLGRNIAVCSAPAKIATSLFYSTPAEERCYSKPPLKRFIAREESRRLVASARVEKKGGGAAPNWTGTGVM